MTASSGRFLREMREREGLTLKEVERRSRLIAQARHDKRYVVSSARLSQVESNGSLPSIYKLDSLSHVYQISLLDLLRMYGIETGLRI